MLLTVSFRRGWSFPHHLPEAIRRFGGIKWDMLVEGHNMEPFADKLYRKGAAWRERLRWWQYSVWRRTSFYPGRSSVLDGFFFKSVFEAQAAGDLDSVRKGIFRGLLNNPARLANRGVQSILLDAVLGKSMAGRVKGLVKTWN
jgi:hypothetical protein